LNPDDAFAYGNRSIVYRTKGDTDRADLSKVERDRCIRRFAELIEKRDARELSQQSAAKNPPDEPRSRGRPKGTIGIPRKVAEETGVSVDTVRRALNPPAPAEPATVTGL
jgi:hypothetical protein